MKLLRVNQTQWLNVSDVSKIELNIGLNELMIDGTAAFVGIDSAQCELFVKCLAEWVSIKAATAPKVLTNEELLERYRSKHEPTEDQ